MEKTVSSNHLGGYDTTTTVYTFTGKPKTVTHVHTATGKTQQTQVYTYTYDHADRVKTVTHKLNAGSAVMLADNTYDDLGRLKKNSRNSVSSLSDTYEYNVRSWLTGISGAQHTENLTYDYNGNISSMQWRLDGTTRKYAYSYDPLSRLVSVTFSGGKDAERYSTSYSYDKHGNILSLQRYGKTANSDLGVYGLADNLTMTYNGNQLTNVSDAAVTVTLPESNDFKKGSTVNPGYVYDKNGNLTKDLNKKITAISYNSLHLPELLTIDGVTHKYTYAADGRKLKVTQGSTSRDYVGSVIYENGSLKRILFEGGYIEGGTYYFYFNDHLGNVRAVIDGGNHNIQFNHYYPFGLPMAETSDGKQNEQPYKYNGKEFERKNGLNWMDYGARHYDAALGRFTTMDRFAEKYYSMSPYQYAGNNPVANVDINGDSIVILNYGYYQKQHMAMLIQSETGKWQYYSINGDNVYISGKFSGGRKADDIAVGEFYSPQEFMDSPYNTEGDGDNLSINSFGFSEGYLIPSSEVQDNTMRETFTNMSNDKEYDLLGNNCATTVQKVMKAAGLKTYNDKQQKYRVPDNRSFGESSFIVTHKNLHPIIPSVLYKSIIRHNPQGKTIHKTKK